MKRELTVAESAMNSVFQDHFSAVAANYGSFRPTYPHALFAHLARVSPADGLVWDCAAGNGQASVSLARHSPKVIATDASAEQSTAAPPHPRIEYLIAPAEASGLKEAMKAIDIAGSYSFSDAHVDQQVLFRADNEEVYPSCSSVIFACLCTQADLWKGRGPIGSNRGLLISG